MSEQELIIIPKENALTVFSADDGLEPFMQKIRAEIDAFVPDISTKKGRDAVASIAHKVAKSKTYLDGVGKDLVAELKELPKKIDASRKTMRDTLDAWKDEVRLPLTEWEKAEEQRKFAHEQSIAAILLRADENSDLDAIEINANLEWLDSIELGAIWEEYELEAVNAISRARASLTAALDKRIKYEVEQTELARLRAESEARAIKDREEQIAKEAVERERRQAQEKADAEKLAAETREREIKQAAEKRELELQLQAERAEREKQEALRRLQQAIEDAQRRADEAVEAEKKRVADEEARIAAEAKAREKDRSHKALINKTALEAFVAGGMTEECAKLAVTLIAKRSIPNVSITY